MKQTILIAASFLIILTTVAQDEEPKTKGFNINRVFFGSSLNLGLSGNYLNLGLNPEIGYSLTNWLDAGMVANLNYFSQNNSSYKESNFNYGVGGFLRIWPLDFIHLQIQPEFNWISSSRNFNNGGPTQKYNSSAGSLLAGIGYGSRQIGSRFSHFTIMIDLLDELNSPYRDQYGGQLPVFRAGFGVYLKARN